MTSSNPTVLVESYRDLFVALSTYYYKTSATERHQMVQGYLKLKLAHMEPPKAHTYLSRRIELEQERYAVAG